MTIIWCMVPEIWSMTDRIFCHFVPFFALFLPLNNRKNQNFKKMKKASRYHHFTHVYHKWQWYDVWFLRSEVWWTEFFVILDCILSFTIQPPNPPTPRSPPKIKILKHWKKLLEISSFYTGVPKIMIICHTVPEIWEISFYISVPKIMIIWCTVPEI